jgi:hypothetical protein
MAFVGKRPVQALGIAMFISALVACEYSDDGAATHSSPTPTRSTPVQASPDPAREARILERIGKVDTLLGPESPEHVFSILGGIGGGTRPVDNTDFSGSNGLGGNVQLPGGTYELRASCIGDIEARLTVVEGTGTRDLRSIPCGKVTELELDLGAGIVTVGLVGTGKGSDAVGSVRINKSLRSAGVSPRP